MNSSNELFTLVKSMTKQEKRYFKLYATFYTNNNANRYTRLFDELDKQEVYNHEQLETAVRSFIEKRYLAKSRHQLTKIILNSLAAYDSGNSTRAELREALAHIEIMFNRGLYSHCQKAINKARSKALRYERYATLIEILEWEYRLTMRTMPKAFDKRVAEQQKEFHRIVTSLQDIARHQKTLTQIITLIHHKNTAHESQSHTNIGQEIEKILSEGISSSSTIGAQIIHYQTLSMYFWIIEDHATARDNYRTTIELWDSNPALIRDQPSMYRRDLRNYLTCCFSLNDFTDFPQTTEKFKSLPTTSLEDAVSTLKDVCTLELAYYLNIGELENALRVAGEIEAGLKTYAASFDPHSVVSLLVNCAMTAFLSGKFPKALEHIAEISKRTQTELRLDLQKFAHIFSLILYYELDDLYSLETQLRRTQRFMANSQGDYPFGQCVVDSVKQLMNCFAGSEQQILEDLWQQLLVMFHDKESTPPTGLTELLFWMESKLKGEDIADVYSNRMHKHRNPDNTDLFPKPAMLQNKQMDKEMQTK